jgi:hypothetical protein
MKKNLFLAVLVLITGGSFASSGVADDTLVKFKGGIGVIPVSSGVGTAATATTVNRNIVRGVQPPGQIWTIRDLDAKIKSNGDIDVQGKGLILAGGNSIGRATGQSVFATLFCGTTTITEHSTDLSGVPLAPNGDFKIDDVLTPTPSSDCPSPVLLIRNANGGAWFAAGILN